MRPVYYCDGEGLYLQDKTREMGLGSVRVVTLAKARQKSQHARTQI